MHKNLMLTMEDLKEGQYRVIRFTGEFDKAGHSEVREELDELVKNFEGKNLIFDFAGLKFINSEGIGYLMEIHTHLMNKDKKLIVVSLNAYVKDVFHTIGMSEIIPVFDDVDSVLNN